MDTAVLKQKIIKLKSKESLASIRLVLSSLLSCFTHLEESMRRSKESHYNDRFEHPVPEERIYPDSPTLLKPLFPSRWRIRHLWGISRSVKESVMGPLRGGEDTTLFSQEDGSTD